jgi:hypothetical protein
LLLKVKELLSVVEDYVLLVARSGLCRRLDCLVLLLPVL